MGRNVLGPHLRERIAFLAGLGDARLEQIKIGLACTKICHFHDKMLITGTGESAFGPHRRRRIVLLAGLWEPRRNLAQTGEDHVRPKGKAYLRDKTYD